MTTAAPEWFARISEGACPRPGHPRLDPDHGGPNAGGYAWCPECQVEWLYDTTDVWDMLRLRIRDTASKTCVDASIDPGFLARSDEWAAHILERTVRRVRLRWDGAQ